MSDELTPFEKRLTQLEPKSNIDPEQLVFSLGQANVVQPRNTAAWQWKAFAICSAISAVVMFALLVKSMHALGEAKQREVALLERLSVDPEIVASQDTILQETQDNTQREDNSASPQIELAAFAANLSSQFQQKRLAFDNKASVPRRPREDRDDAPVSWGETRRVLAMVGESSVGLRRIETLQPR